MKIIGITGDSGVGKSSLTLLLSEKLKCSFLDIDKLILNDNSLGVKNTPPSISEMKPEYFKLLVDNLENLESPISILINNLVENEIKKLLKKNDDIIIEWMFLPYLKIWQKCNTKILIKANEILRKSNALKNELITEEKYDKCVAIVKLDFNKFDYDYIFENSYDNKSFEDILDRLSNKEISK